MPALRCPWLAGTAKSPLEVCPLYYWNWLRHIVRLPETTNFPTAPDPAVAEMSDPAAIEMAARPSDPFPRRSIALRHLDAGSCNGCESELSLLSSPDYDFTRYGFSFTPSPKHADILVITGVITEAMVPIIHNVFEQMAAPKRVLALGTCAIDGGVFAGAPGVVGSLSGIVPVTVAVAGCPPSPGDILRGLLTIADHRDPLASRKAVSR